MLGYFRNKMFIKATKQRPERGDITRYTNVILTYTFTLI